MAVESVARKGDGGEDGVLHPRAEGAVDEGDKIVGTRRRIALGPRKWRAQVDETPREIVDVVAEWVPDGHDDTIGLRRVDGLAPLEVFSSREAVGVAIGDVPRE